MTKAEEQILWSIQVQDCFEFIDDTTLKPIPTKHWYDCPGVKELLKEKKTGNQMEDEKKKSAKEGGIEALELLFGRGKELENKCHESGDKNMLTEVIAMLKVGARLLSFAHLSIAKSIFY